MMDERLFLREVETLGIGLAARDARTIGALLAAILKKTGPLVIDIAEIDAIRTGAFFMGVDQDNQTLEISYASGTVAECEAELRKRRPGESIDLVDRAPPLGTVQ